jgi:hypothetical protein
MGVSENADLYPGIYPNVVAYEDMNATQGFLRCPATRMDARFLFFKIEIYPKIYPQVIDARALFRESPGACFLGSYQTVHV